MSSSNNKQKQKLFPPNIILRSSRLKDIDVLYKNQIREICKENQVKAEKQQGNNYPNIEKKNGSFLKTNIDIQYPEYNFHHTVESISAKTTVYNNLDIFTDLDQRTKQSTSSKIQQTKHQILRHQNQQKELKIKELACKCQQFLQKLKGVLKPTEFEFELENLNQVVNHKMRSLKLKNQELLQNAKKKILSIFQQFGIMKQQMNDIYQISSQGYLLKFVLKKIKNKIKDFQKKNLQFNFQLQKDKIAHQNILQNNNFLTQTNQLLRLSETKLKAKVQDLKNQLNQFFSMLNKKQAENEQLQNELFKQRKYNQELNGLNIKLSHTLKEIKDEQISKQKYWEITQKEMKHLLSTYFIQIKKLQTIVEERQGEVQETLLKAKFIQQQNEKLNRELIRLKERHEWIEKDYSAKNNELQDELEKLTTQFDRYKEKHNEAIQTCHHHDMQQALRKVQQYQRAYESILLELEDQKRLFSRAEEQYKQALLCAQQELLEKAKQVQKLRYAEQFQSRTDIEIQKKQLLTLYQRKQKQFSQQMETNMRTILAEKDKKTASQLIHLQYEKDELRREILHLKELLKAKEDFINVIRHQSQFN